MLAAAACIGPDAIRSEPPATGAVPTASAAATESTAPSESPAPTDEPSPTDEPAATETPEPTEDASPSPTASDGASAGVCAGNDDNRLFYDKVATAVDWPVYCPVLASGWFVDAGEYKSAGGGWMRIAYKGPGGARLELSEGFFCSDDDGCVPDGEDAGAASIGGLQGTLVVVADGRNAIVADRGSSPSWVVIGSGLDVEVFRSLVADFALVGG